MKNLLRNILANSIRWKATEKGDKIIYANEQDPRLIVFMGLFFRKEYNAPRGHIYAVEDVRNILRTGAPKMQMMAHKQWHVGLVKVQTFLV